MPNVYGKEKMKSLMLNHVEVQAPFQHWGLDFIGEIHPNSSDQHKYILTATDYFTKWVEAIPTQKDDKRVIMTFLEDYILSRFRCLRKFMLDSS